MQRIISLNGPWAFREAGAETWKEGRVPGCVQLDLLNLGEVSDPYYRLNELDMYALETKEWVYRRQFNLDAEDLHDAHPVLVFEGIDTYADVYLNEQFLGHTENMFVPQRFDVGGIAAPGANNLKVRFGSSLNTIKGLERNSPVAFQSSCESARLFARKAQYAFGWDWGPRIAQVGLWRSVYVQLIHTALVTEPFCYAEEVEPERARVRVTGRVVSYVPEDLAAEIVVSFGGAEQARASVPVVNEGGGPGFSASLEIDSPRLWWPNGLGEQPLYDIAVTLRGDSGIADAMTFRCGIRMVKLEQQTDPEGTSFVLLINGVRVFAKGANWIPAESLLPRLTSEDYRAQVRMAQQAHMNMLRIWGGGIYEDPAFYEACDEMGIMVWQDFMYACAQYPDEFDWFQKLAREEAESVVTSLRNHPSLVLWCGNNENNWGFDEWWHNGQPKYLGNYIYREILPQVCARLDPSRPYWVSSPYGGEHPNSMSTGDRHSWTVWSGWQDYSGYLHDSGRFVSEFGFQAMPNWKTVQAYSAPEDRHILSPVMRSHNKMAEGMERLTRFMVGRLGFPKDFQSFVYLTQFNQAEAVRTGVEHWRLRQFRTAGALYWQLNDCWPVASWSSVDYYRRKKALYYYTQRFFSPICPVLRMEDGTVCLYGMSDSLKEKRGEARIAVYALDGRRFSERRIAVRLSANGVTALGRWSPAELGIGNSRRVLPVDGVGTTNPREHNGALLDSVVYVALSDGDAVYANYLTFARFRDLSLQSPRIEIVQRGEEITLVSDVPAFGVFLESQNDVDLSNNCLNMEPGLAYTVTCSAPPGAVQVFNLHDMVARV